MKKIKTFGLTNLRVEECFGYLKLVQTETANLPLQDEDGTGSPSVVSLASTASVLDASVTSFTTAVEAFDTALKASDTNPATAKATAADDARDAAWRGANNYAAAMCAHPDADLKPCPLPKLISPHGSRNCNTAKSNSLPQLPHARKPMQPVRWAS